MLHQHKPYFAVQTRKQEITEREYSELTEDEKRFYQRNLTKKGNYSLNQTAKKAGVKNFDKFHNFGYKGLYNGETAGYFINYNSIIFFYVDYFYKILIQPLNYQVILTIQQNYIKMIKK